MISQLLLTCAHVPSYPPYSHNCAGVHPSGHKLSQVAYLRGSGGIEVHLESDTSPIDTKGGELIDFDVVLRDEVDLTTFALYVGCGGCMKDDPIATPRIHDAAYQDPHVEPFTQTRIRSLFPEGRRKYNSTQLSAALCAEKHFTIRLEDFGNRSDGRAIVWSPVLGIQEVFTSTEVASFPIYILLNHGSAWTELGWTYAVFLFFIAPLVLRAWRAHGSPYPNTLHSNPLWVDWGGAVPTVTLRVVDPRETMYDIAIHAFVAAALEELFHLFYAQMGAPLNYQLGLGLAVVAVSQVLPIWYVTMLWNGLLTTRGTAHASSTLWNLWEIAMAIILGIFWLGAGFYVAPLALFVAGVLHFLDPDVRVVDTSDKAPCAPALSDRDLPTLLLSEMLLWGTNGGGGGDASRLDDKPPPAPSGDGRGDTLVCDHENCWLA